MMNKKDLVDRVMRYHMGKHLPRYAVEYIVNGVLGEIIKEVTTGGKHRGGEVKLVGFGTFKTKVRKARDGHHPGTGEKIHIPEKTVAIFKPGHRFRDRLSRPRAMSPS